MRSYSVASLFLAAFVRTGVQGFSLKGRTKSSVPSQFKSSSLGGPLFISTATPLPDLEMSTNNVAVNDNEIPSLGTIAKMLPKSSFEISTKTSLLYFFLDLAAVASSMTFLHSVVTSDFYHAAPVWEQGLMAFPLQILTGFACWITWCIGHDAGHGTVSKKHKWVNRLVGEVAHSMVCLTPYVPWKMSHLRHHLNHNHLSRDYSHQWFIREEKDDLPKVFQLAYEFRMLQLPFLYFVYLFMGIPDGGHVFFYGRLWKDVSLKEKLDGSISAMISVATAGFLWNLMGTADFVVVCLMPWLVCSFWLFMVTYLQHHSDDGKLYTDDTWTFTRGAFETVDRDYGKWINRLSHHMMDGHVVHHLFFTKVPHYRLEEATKALVEGLEERDMSNLYKSIETKDFTQEIIKKFNDDWFFIDEAQVER